MLDGNYITGVMNSKSIYQVFYIMVGDPWMLDSNYIAGVMTQ